MVDEFSRVFGKFVARGNARPLNSEEQDDKRIYCQWRAGVLHEKITRGHLTQDSGVQYMRDQMASEIRDVRNNWSNAQWREFAEEGVNVPATTYKAERIEIAAYIEEMKGDFEAERRESSASDDGQDLMVLRRDLQDRIHDIQNISLKHWSERDQVRGLVHDVFDSDLIKNIQGMFEREHSSMQIIAMTQVRNLYNNGRTGDGDGITDWAVENGYLTVFDVARLKKGEMPDISRELRPEDTGDDLSR